MLGLNYDLDIKEYHAQKDFKVHYVSSSQLKTMLDDPELFYRTYITKEIEREPTSAMDIGSYFHTAILEPHLVDKEFAFFEGSVRRGKAWDSFIENNSGKILLTQSDKEKGDVLVQGVKNSPVALQLLTKGSPEVSCGANLLVDLINGQIFYKQSDRLLILDKDGWTEIDSTGFDSMGYFEIRVKVRADYLSTLGILDLKSTSSRAKNYKDVLKSIEMYQYDMSAALYLDIFNLFLDSPLENFYWIFAQKDIPNSKTWVASKDTIRVGRAKWKKAVIDLARCINLNWEFRDELGVVEPSYWDKEWIKDPIEKDALKLL
jgi:hypothetical protein